MPRTSATRPENVRNPDETTFRYIEAADSGKKVRAMPLTIESQPINVISETRPEFHESFNARMTAPNVRAMNPYSQRKLSFLVSRRARTPFLLSINDKPATVKMIPKICAKVI